MHGCSVAPLMQGLPAHVLVQGQLILEEGCVQGHICYLPLLWWGWLGAPTE